MTKMNIIVALIVIASLVMAIDGQLSMPKIPTAADIKAKLGQAKEGAAMAGEMIKGAVQDPKSAMEAAKSMGQMAIQDPKGTAEMVKSTLGGK